MKKFLLLAIAFTIVGCIPTAPVSSNLETKTIEIKIENATGVAIYEGKGNWFYELEVTPKNKCNLVLSEVTSDGNKVQILLSEHASDGCDAVKQLVNGNVGAKADATFETKWVSTQTK